MLNQKLMGASGPANYIEDVFSTYLYTGNGSTQTITNGIDLAGKGGLVWIKDRSNIFGVSHVLTDTARGVSNYLVSNTTNAQATPSGTSVSSFNSNGFGMTYGSGFGANVNYLDDTFVSWTFRKQPKFFDVVTYTGDGNTTQVINHSLGSVPGCIIVKRIDSATNWFVYHKDLTSYQYSLYLNDTTGQINAAGSQFGADPTSTQFTVGSGYPNTSGGQYVAYLFAHNAGGFGLTGTDNVISCGSVTLDGSGNATVNLGYEPQWVMIKRSDNTSDWYMHDTMRGLDLTTYTRLYADTAGAELTSTPTYIAPSSTGFNLINGFSSAGGTWIYIAIRRGPMKVPTDGTTVFKPVTATPSGSQGTYTTNFPTDLIITTERGHASTGQTFVSDRLRGTTTASRMYLNTAGTGSEVSGGAGGFGLDSNDSVFDNLYPGAGITNPVIYWNFKRSPSFFDEVCYTGTGANRTVSHNLGVAPEMIIVKSRNGGAGREWIIYAAPLGNTKALQFNTYGPNVDVGYWNNTTPSASTFTIGTEPFSNTSGELYVSYLFATCPGVSKVGSYTGNGSSQTINCGFTAGARFVLIKRTDSTGDWYVWDTARGIVSGNDPHLSLNTTSAEVTTDDSIDTDSTGFVVNQLSATNVNVSSATYIYLAIA